MPVEPKAAWGRVAAFTRGVARTPSIEALLGCERVVLAPADVAAHSLDAVVGWGQKDNHQRALEFASRHKLPYWRAEDGFLRSVGLGAEGAPPLSVVLDDLGIYYDARTPSRLEQICAETRLDDPRLLRRAGAAMQRIRSSQLSKYNNSPPDAAGLRPSSRERVLVLDQTYGDMSVRCGLADAGTFARMLRAAIEDNPDAEIIVKTHPDVVAGKKRGYLPHSDHARVQIMAAPVNPIALLEQVDRVYVVTSQLGFEALMLGKPVICFGVPFYAGWGLTDDRGAVRRRGRRLSIEELFAAAYIEYPRYIDPDSGEPCEIERVIEHLALQRARFTDNQGDLFCFGFQFWKRNWARAYLRCPGNRIRFAYTARHAKLLGFNHRSRIVVWGQREVGSVRRLSEEYDAPIWRMEDGFLRSVGLGSDLAAPASLVLDQEGMYYDPRRPSALETILETAEFSSQLLTRARQLRERIVEAQLSKYNVGAALDIEIPQDTRVILVPGQVEDDASIQLGCRDIRSNQALLEAARMANPEAFIIYKPHPDVVSGNRKGELALAAARRICDHVEADAALPPCLAVADEVHTMTSLVGFESLMRGISVVVYGQPFYCGWGLTSDRHAVARRKRRLSLDELVAGTLLLYPRYLNRRTGRFTRAEAIIRQLIEERARAGASSVKLPWPRRQLRKLIGAYKGVTQAP